MWKGMQTLASIRVPYLAGNDSDEKRKEEKKRKRKKYAVKSALPDAALEVSDEILLLQTAPL
jgi:hypothetical protein